MSELNERAVCAHCAHANRVGARVCARCGKALAPAPALTPAPVLTPALTPASAPRCRRCGQVNRPAARFCRCCGAPLDRGVSAGRGRGPAEESAPRPAAPLLNGRYRILRPLAEGGMGAVYQVSDAQQPGAVWALKAMDLAAVDPADQAEAVTAFRREAALLATLDHPNLVKVVDHFSAGGKECLVMECVAGETLDACFRHTPRDEAHVLPVALQLCAVLDYLHSRTPPIIYRDLKPHNAMIEAGAPGSGAPGSGAPGSGGRVKLIDFGIARFYKPGKQKDTTMMGTPGFAPPEQYGGGQTDARSDLFSLGVTLHVLLTDYDVEQSPWSYPPVRALNPQASAALERVIAKATAMNAAERYQTAAEMRDALLACRSQVTLAT